MLPRSIARASAITLTLGITAALIAGCTSAPAGGSSAAGDSKTDPFQHVHELALDPAGDILVATHGGLYRVSEDGATQGPIGGLDIDAMGFTLTGTTAYASGHPGPATPRRFGNPSLGLLRSADLGRTWQTVSLRSEVDFHALAAQSLPGAPDRLVGLATGHSRLLRSSDGGATWTEGATLMARVLLYSGDRLLATTADGLAVSTDDGLSFTVDPSAPRLYLLAGVGSSAPTGVDVDGTIWAMDPAGTWTRGGATTGAAEAMGADGARIVVLDTRGIATSTDRGETWTILRPRS